MPVSFNIRISESDLAAIKIVTAGIKNGAARSLSMAINDTLDGVRTDMVQQVADTYNLTKTRIRKDIKAPFKTNSSSLYGYVRAQGIPIRFVEGASTGGTFNFSSEAIRTGGVRAKILKNGSLQIYKNAFAAIMPNGHLGFYQRQYRREHATSRTVYGGIKANKLPWKMWYPGKMDPHRHLTQLVGPSAEDAFSTRSYPTAMQTIQDKAKVRMDKNIGYQIDYQLSKF